MTKKHKRKYQKPTYKLEEKMTFPFDGILKFIKDNKEVTCVCRQCSSCHGCR